MEHNCVVDVCEYLLTSLKKGCKEVQFVASYPSELTDFPVKKPTASLGISNASLPFSECIFEGVDVMGNKYYGTTATFEFSLNICVPKTMPGIECYKAFDKIADVCLGLDSVTITNVYCGEIKYNRTMGALVLSAGINLSVELCTIVETGVKA